MDKRTYTEMDLLIHIDKMLKEYREDSKAERADIINQIDRMMDYLAEIIGILKRLEDSESLTRADIYFIKDRLKIEREA